MLFDFRIALRGLRRNPGYSTLAVLTLALGIGANTAMFSVVNAVILRPLPGRETGRLVRILDTSHATQSLPHDAFLEVRGKNASFEVVSGYQTCLLNLTAVENPEQLSGPCVTSNWFELQRVPALIGRTFLPDEDQPGKNRVVVLDYGFWQRRFGGDTGAIGRTIQLNQQRWRIIGVMPPDFKPVAAAPATIYTPFVIADNPGLAIQAVARLKNGISLSEARAEMKVMGAHIAAAYPAEDGNLQMRVDTVLETLTGPQRPMLIVLLGAVSLVLLIACVNVANLALARSAAREHEIGIRAALGASRVRIARFVLAEALLVSIAASIVALVIAQAALSLLRPLTASLPRADELALDSRVFLAALVLGAAAALLSGILPAVRAARSQGAAGMRSRATARWQSGLVAGEVALAFVLAAGAGLLIRTFVNMRAVSLGYDPRNVLTSFLAQPPTGNRAAGVALYSRIRDRIQVLPGVRGVATATRMPTGGVGIQLAIQPEGQPSRPEDRKAMLDVISPDYFQVAGIPIRAGRAFNAADRDSPALVAIVSESAARRHFAGDAVGRRIVVPRVNFDIGGNDEAVAQVVGIAGNICTTSVSDCDSEQLYLPEGQSAIRYTYLMVKTEGDPMALERQVRRAVTLESPATPLDPVAKPLETRASYLTDGSNRGMWLLGVFAGLALSLAALGIYGVSAYLAAQRRQEIGIRMALGASRSDVVRLLSRRCLASAAAGLIAGGAAAAGLSRLLRGSLFGVTPADPATLLLAAALLLVVSWAAVAVPAWLSAAEDPSRTLRMEH